MTSLGYADDTNILVSSLPSLRALNDYFMRFNALRLNHANASWWGELQVAAVALAATGITIDGHCACTAQRANSIPWSAAVMVTGRRSMPHPAR
jgi:hypothetical protein